MQREMQPCSDLSATNVPFRKRSSLDDLIQSLLICSAHAYISLTRLTTTGDHNVLEMHQVNRDQPATAQPRKQLPGYEFARYWGFSTLSLMIRACSRPIAFIFRQIVYLQRFYAKTINHRQATFASQLRVNRSDTGAIHLFVNLVAEILFRRTRKFYHRHAISGLEGHTARARPVPFDGTAQ